MTDDSPLSRRAFVRLSAATAGALALPGNAYADVSNDAFDAEYEFVQNHTPTDHAVPTLVTFTDASGPDALASALDTAVVTTTEPRPAASAQLTTAQATTAAELPTAETLSHSPGSLQVRAIDPVAGQNSAASDGGSTVSRCSGGRRRWRGCLAPSPGSS